MFFLLSFVLRNFLMKKLLQLLLFCAPPPSTARLAPHRTHISSPHNALQQQFHHHHTLVSFILIFERLATIPSIQCSLSFNCMLCWFVTAVHCSAIHTNLETNQCCSVIGRCGFDNQAWFSICLKMLTTTVDYQRQFFFASLSSTLDSWSKLSLMYSVNCLQNCVVVANETFLLIL